MRGLAGREEREKNEKYKSTSDFILAVQKKVFGLLRNLCLIMGDPWSLSFSTGRKAQFDTERPAVVSSTDSGHQGPSRAG